MTLLIALLSGSVAGATMNSPPLEETLAAIDQAARHYSSHALRFTSDEKIVLKRGPATETHRFRYIYVVDDEGRRVEHREPVNRKQNPNAVGITSPYNWIFVFDSRFWEYFDYEWIGIETRLDREAIGLGFGPRGGRVLDGNEWHGIAWFDRTTHLPLVVEAWEPEEYERKLEFDRRLAAAANGSRRSRSTHVVTNTRVEFKEERNGLRLPTRVTMREVRYVVWGKNGTAGYREQALATAKQLYTNYRFYAATADDPVFD